VKCPNCGGRSIGRVGSEQYYCWDCCVEFNVGRGAVRVWHVDPDGELVAAAHNKRPDPLMPPLPLMQRR
jgi:hypothetical protein